MTGRFFYAAIRFLPCASVLHKSSEVLQVNNEEYEAGRYLCRAFTFGTK